MVRDSSCRMTSLLVWYYSVYQQALHDPSIIILIAEHDCAFGMLECFSGIVDGLVGTIVAPNGAQITHKSYVEVGGADNQGYLRIAERNLTNADTGVYTIAMPDDENLNMNFYIGLFCMGFNGKKLQCTHRN